jgi:EPS-associated MarR family transcriptional regulator
MKHLEETVKLLNHIHENPEATQRVLVEELDFSLGKVNYLIKALTEKGIIKLKSFKSSRKKAGYLYLLTPKGIKRKAEITRKFLEQRLKEYDKLQEEIEMLKMRLKATGESQD